MPSRASLFSLSFLGTWALSSLNLASAYSFHLNAQPQQCGPLSLTIDGTDGKPPYTALVVPFGPQVGKDELRRIFQRQFTENSTNFTMPYPQNSQFVIMVSDSNGIGTGGTSVGMSVSSSKGGNDACLPAPNENGTTFSFQILPTTAINQCSKATLAWTPNTVKGDVKILALIPGGQSELIPYSQSDVKDEQGSTKGFDWVPNIRTGTNIILVAGDDNGPGSGGSAPIAVGNNPNGDGSCINDNSPSLTSGTPAGSIQTGKANSGSSGSSSNTGAIVGGIIAGIAALIILFLLLWFVRRRKRHQKHQDVDLLPGEAGHAGEGNNEFYQPEPFVIPPSSRANSNLGTFDDTGTRPSMSEAGRRYSALSTTDASDSQYTSGLGLGMAGGPATSRTTASRKTPGGPGPLRPVNVVQHEDGGEIPEPGTSAVDEVETVELPPAYTMVKSRVGPVQEENAGGSGSVRT